MDKNSLRIIAKEQRKTLDITKISSLLVEKIKNLNAYKQAKDIMLFYPTKYEINLLDLLEDNKTFYLPKVCEENLLICPYHKGDNLIKSNFGIYEPCSNPIKTTPIDIIIVPALMIDKNKYRLGYGKGFYDRFLKTIDTTTICAIAKELVVDNLPHDKHDVPIDLVISA